MKIGTYLAIVWLLLSISSSVCGQENFKPKNFLALEHRLVAINAKVTDRYDSDSLFKPKEETILHCCGIIINSKLAAATNHFFQPKFVYRANGTPARLIAFSPSADISLFKVEFSDFLPIKYDFYAGVGQKAWTVKKEHNSGYRWEYLGEIAEVYPQEIYLPCTLTRAGDSGRPVFSDEGKLIGIIRGMLIDLQTAQTKATVVVPAREVARLAARIR